MGSSTSKPRKGHEKPKHLPKVGSPANEQWEHETHKSVMFGSGAKAGVIVLVLMVGLVGWLLITL